MTSETPTGAPEKRELKPLLKLTLELGPLLLFFLANERGEQAAATFPAVAALGGPLFFATAVFIVATLVSLAVSFALTRRLPIMPFVTGIVVLVFGSLTLWLQNETFIKLKPTIIYVLFGGILLGGLAFGRSLLGYVFDAVFRLTERGWRVLTFRWALFFLALAVLNEIVWRNFSDDAWVTFKVFGVLPLTFLFTLTQLPLIQREQLPEDGEGA